VNITDDQDTHLLAHRLRTEYRQPLVSSRTDPPKLRAQNNCAPPVFMSGNAQQRPRLNEIGLERKHQLVGANL
jgi:hypothetical protein